MPDHIDKVMRARVQPEQLAIEHVGKCREWMPVIRINMRERPLDIAPAHACADMRVLANVKWIIEVDELVMDRLAEYGPNECEKKNNDRATLPGMSFHVVDRQLRWLNVLEDRISLLLAARLVTALESKTASRLDNRERSAASLYNVQSPREAGRRDASPLPDYNERARLKVEAPLRVDNTEVRPPRVLAREGDCRA